MNIIFLLYDQRISFDQIRTRVKVEDLLPLK